MKLLYKKHRVRYQVCIFFRLVVTTIMVKKINRVKTINLYDMMDTILMEFCPIRLTFQTVSIGFCIK